MTAHLCPTCRHDARESMRQAMRLAATETVLSFLCGPGFDEVTRLMNAFVDTVFADVAIPDPNPIAFAGSEEMRRRIERATEAKLDMKFIDAAWSAVLAMVVSDDKWRQVIVMTEHFMKAKEVTP